MGKIFTLSDDIRQIASDSIDDLIDQLGKPCRLVYPPLGAPCTGCGGAPAGHWVTGGGATVGQGAACPLCGGAGLVYTEASETVTLLVASAPAQFFRKAAPGVDVPAGTIQTKGYVRDLPKILRAREMVLAPGALPHTLRYVLDGEPVDVSNIVQGRYAVCQWRRAGG